jgi:arginine-tRNA-protein transferase
MVFNRHFSFLIETNLILDIFKGMWAYRLGAKGYQSLIDRGWRRSGKYCYKPLVQDSCCPAYTIRCEALNVLVTRSQKKVLKRVQQFIQHDHRPTKWCKSVHEERDGQQGDLPTNDNVEGDDSVPMDTSRPTNSQAAELNISGVSKRHPCPSTAKSTLTSVRTEEDLKSVLDKVKSNSSKAKCKRLLNSLNKLVAKEKIDELIAFAQIRDKHSNRIKAEDRKRSLEHLLDVNTQTDSKHKLKVIPYFFFQIKQSINLFDLKIKLVPSNDPNTIQEAHKLFQKYQRHVHHDKEDKITFSQFEHFLVENPFYVRSLT